METREPLFREQIDGPTNDGHERYTQLQIAGGVIRNIQHIGWFMLHSDPEEDKPQGYRIGSWVEAPDEKLGYAFGLSRANPIPNTLEDFTINSKYFIIDRERQQLAEDPKEVDVKVTEDLKIEAEKLADTYDKRDLIISLNIVQKLAGTILTRKFYSEMDVHVGYGLILNNLEPLAEMFPSPRSH